MDHLPYPVGQHTHTQIQCSADIRVYEPEEFFKYPGLKDVRYKDLLENGLPVHFDPNLAQEFLQTWLWFMLLAQTLNEPIDGEDFTERHGPKSYFHTRNLNTYIEKWIQKESEEFARKKGLTQEQKVRYFRASAALSDARRFVVKHLSCAPIGQRHLDDSETSAVVNKLPRVLTLSFAILGETLQHERPKLFDGVQTAAPFWKRPSSEEDSWGYSNYCRKQLLAREWCPSDIYRLESTLDGVRVMYYASALPAPDAAFAPRKTWNHSKCTALQCVHINDREHESTYHMPSCTDPTTCHRISIDIGDNELIKYINQGRTPLVTLENDGRIHCRPYDLKHNVRFGVVSHTWEDKILHSVRAGDRDDRSIHFCQMKDLQRSFDDIIHGKEGHRNGSNHVPFWVDVLCNTSRPSMTGKVLDSTRDIYSKASAVLVWDRGLLNVNLPNSSIEANLLIRTSQWAQRLWTFSEAVLARNIIVKFQDTSINVETIHDTRREAEQQLYDEFHHVWEAGYPFSSVTWSLRKAMRAIDSGKDLQEAKYAVQWAWQAVQFRRVTNVADETKVMAQVLGVPATSISEIEDSEDTQENVAARRMVLFLDLLDASEALGIPSGIIFLPGPSLRIPGYEWAPKTWLSKQAHAYPLFRPLRPAARMHKRGLHVHFPGLALLCPSDPPIAHKIWVAVHQSLHKWYKIVVEVSDGFDAFWENKVLNSEQASIIMCTDEPRERWEIGVLVTKEGSATQGQIRVVKVLCRVWMRLETNPNVLQLMQDQVRQDPEGTFLGEPLDKDTEWCITGNEMLGTERTR
jgi:hypothetical protein